MKNNKFILICILFFGSLIRIATLGKYMSFTPDEEYQAYITQTLLKNFHIIWIGLSNGSFGLFLGPYWQYALYPFLLIFKGDPIAMGYLAVIFGILTIPIVYYLGLKMFNWKAGVIASLLYSFSAMSVYYDQKPYPSAISFLSVLMALSIFMTKYSKKWWIVFAISFGFVFHTHLSLLPFMFVGLYFFLKERKGVDKKTILFSLMGLLFMIAPLIAFDYFHKGSNISAPFKVFFRSDRPKFGSTIPYHFDSLLNSFGRFFYLKPYSNSTDEILWPCVSSSFSTYTKAPIIISILSLSIFIFFLIDKQTWRHRGKKILALLGLALVIPFVFFSAVNPIEYYLIGFYPLFYLMIASIISELTGVKKIIAYILVSAAIFMGLFTILTAKSDFGLNTKKNMVGRVLEIVKNEPFELSESGDCHRFEGWRYLFSAYGRKPEKSSEDPNFGWLYPDELSNKKVKYSVLINESKIYSEVDANFKYSLTEGGFTAYIYDREKVK